MRWGWRTPGQTVSLGRLSFGPEIARRYLGADGTGYEPLVRSSANGTSSVSAQARPFRL